MSELSLLSVAPDYVLRERSNYQLKYFVIGQHDTPEMQYRQIILEAKDLLFKVKYAELDRKILKEKIARKKDSDEPIQLLKAQQMELRLALLNDTLEATWRELNYLVELAREYPYYSPEDIEANQKDYWDKRLTRQASIDRAAIEQGVTAGNLTALFQAGIVQNELTS